MKYYSEQLNKVFDTPEALQAEEEKVNAVKRAEEEKKAKLKAEREERAKEVEQAIKEAYEARKRATNALNAFCKDFGAYHTSLRGAIEGTAFEEIFSTLLGNLF